MATCPVATAQKIAVASCLGGIAISLAQRIYTSPEFFALRRNKYVFSALTFGPACCVIYFLVAMHGYVNPAQFAGYVPYWTFFIYSVCLYAILLERALPLISVSSGWTHQMRQTFRYGGPLVLALPQLICAVIASHLYVLVGQGFTVATLPASALNASKATETMLPIGTFIMLVSNTALSYIFVHALAQYRKQTFKTFILENRVECLNLLFNFFLAWGFLVAKIVGTVFAKTNPAAEPMIFYIFHNYFSPIVTLNTFNDYLFVTKKLPRDILSTQIEVTEKSTPMGTKSKSPGISTRVSEGK
ncbi:hypothetical protein BKA69DRAFT_1069385 [Paraphysoderma sedebokerense]|nr:hypothetical protein BKA69DRAFT_1069385 [Paraphysoderma sedebokerense]